jgi:hypothetical protein
LAKRCAGDDEGFGTPESLLSLGSAQKSTHGFLIVVTSTTIYQGRRFPKNIVLAIKAGSIMLNQKQKQQIVE